MMNTEQRGGSDFYSIGDLALTWVDSVFCHVFMEAGRVREFTKNASLIFMCGLWTEGIVYVRGKFLNPNFKDPLNK